MTLILSNDDVEKLLTMPDCIAVMEEAYVELAEGRGVTRRRSDCMVPSTRPDAVYGLKSMDGVIPKLGMGAIRINSDIITFPKVGNNIRRVAAGSARRALYRPVLLFSCETGEPLATPDGVSAHAGRRRQRLGAKFSHGRMRTVAILGTGWQAGAQLMAIGAVRDIKQVRAFSPNREHRETFAREMSEGLVSTSRRLQPEEAIRGAW
jgi:ornithine cyclodeaminase/alanine dehydrogenase-like protein (mu-crystallin family)